MTAYGITSAPPGVPSDAGSSDTVSPSVESAVAAAHARISEIASDTLQQGSVVGDPLPLPPMPFDDTSELQPEPGTGPDVAQQP